MSNRTIPVAGVDGTPGGWAALIVKAGQLEVRKVNNLSDVFEIVPDVNIVAVDVPIGLLDSYEIGGRACDRAARRLLGRKRASSVFPAPVRSALRTKSFAEACAKSRSSAPGGKGMSKQTFAILSKIKEVDELLKTRRELRDLVREVHPEVSFCELVGAPMVHRKASVAGRDERRLALTRVFENLADIEKSGYDQNLPIEDVFDAAIAYWSAIRLAKGKARSWRIDPTCADPSFWEGIKITLNSKTLST